MGGKKMKKRIKVLCLAIAMAAVGAFGACTQGELKNDDKSFSMVTSWTPSGLVNHYNSNTYCTAFDYFVVEGMWRYVRSTDEIYCQVAAELPTHRKASIEDYKDVIGTEAYNYYAGANNCTEVTVTTGKIRENAKWQNGENVVAKDVWAYYYMIHPTSSNYLAGVKVVDDKTIEFVWNPLKEPTDTVKELLLAQDKSVTIKYDLFAQYVDPVADIVMNSPVNTNQNLWGAFNRFSTSQQITEMTKTRNAFYANSPSWYVATGPFKLQTFSATQILLVKNDFYWNADNIGFERIKLYSSNDLNQTYQLITNGYVDYYDGYIQQDTLEGMLNSNPDLVNLKMYDPGAYGITFNMKKKNTLWTDEVREAFQYIFDREEIKNASNPYATTSWYPVIGMAPSEAKTYMSEKHYNELPKFSTDLAKATTLLEAAGWTKSGGQWTKDGAQVEITMGCPSGDTRASVAAEAAAAQLQSFGIKVNLMKSSGFFSNATSDNSPYDLCLEWTDLNMSFSYPTGSYSQFDAVYSRYAQLDRYPNDYSDAQKAGSLMLEFDGLDGDANTYAFVDYINSFYSVDEEKLTYLVDVFNLGLAKMNLGIQFFQNVTASTLNVGRIDGVPLESYWKENRNVTYVPEAGTEDFFIVAKTNLVYACNYMLAYGIYQPK